MIPRPTRAPITPPAIAPPFDDDSCDPAVGNNDCSVNSVLVLEVLVLVRLPVARENVARTVVF